jgi:hypothetical protein
MPVGKARAATVETAGDQLRVAIPAFPAIDLAVITDHVKARSRRHTVSEGAYPASDSSRQRGTATSASALPTPTRRLQISDTAARAGSPRPLGCCWR